MEINSNTNGNSKWLFHHKGHGKSLKSMGPPSPASASNRLMIMDIAASSLSSVPVGLEMPSNACSSITESIREVCSCSEAGKGIQEKWV